MLAGESPKTGVMLVTSSLQGSLTEIAAEVSASAAGVRCEPSDAQVLEALTGAERIFALGAGRSGLALQMTAMRLMHLGLTVSVVGEVTAPAIGPKDVLLVASGSGTTAGIVRAAKNAKRAGARVIAITTAPESPLGQLADERILVQAPQKQDHSAVASVQYAGSLFEQSVMLIGDALFHELWARSGASAEELWPRHANLE